MHNGEFVVQRVDAIPRADMVQGYSWALKVPAVAEGEYVWRV